jgi:hypothetical protein
VATFLNANDNHKHKNLPSTEKIEKSTDSNLVSVIENEKEISSTKLKKKLKLNTDSKLTDLVTGKKNIKLKLNTDSKLTDLVTGKKKFKLPNPMNGLKKIGIALKPNNPLK